MRFFINLESTEKLSEVTKKVIADFNAMTDGQFMRKYCCTKKTYLMRVIKYKDPYMNAPLARFGKFLIKLGSVQRLLKK